jgi:hypothetical protein
VANFPYKSYCWSLGTTSFRTTDFNVRIERQLALLSEFRAANDGAWSDLQVGYYSFMQKHEFVKGEATRPAKDAREKTSGLVDIGLIDCERKLTDAGRALLAVAESGNFGRDNPLQIPNDSFIYLKQLLKMSVSVDGDIVRPFIVLSVVLSRLVYLSDDEFTYLLPLCTTAENTAVIIDAIEQLRSGTGSIDEIITTRIMAMDNYKAALEYLLAEDVTESVITAVGMNRKSGGTGEKVYDKPYFLFYETLREVVLNRNGDLVLTLHEQSHKINGKPAILWRQYMFTANSRSKLKRDGLAALNDVPLLRASTESEFKRLFFEQLHLFKARATLSDYADLNRRYFKTTDTVIFDDGKVEFDVLPHCWLGEIADRLSEIAFVASYNLYDDVSLTAIAPFLEIDERKLHLDLERIYGIKITSADDARIVVNNERYKRFNTLIDERFGKDALIDLFGKFERRDDNAIRQAVTNNADIPTIFEYVLGIAWYMISDRKGDVLSYMNLSLEADLLPRTHAQGGNADIEYVYEQTAAYPAHTLLIEATLADNSNQRRMEMEPVSRHLGEHVLSSGDANAYCVFISTFLHPSVVGDFRSWKGRAYYGREYASTDVGLKILPLATAELQTILHREVNYDKLYPLFEAAYQSDEPVPTWYEREVAWKLQSNEG